MTEARLDHVPADRRPEVVDQGGTAATVVAREPRNPFVVGITVIWAAFLLLAIGFAIAAGISGGNANDGSYESSYRPDLVTPFLLTAAIFLALAVVGILTHLAVRAVQWKA